LTKRARLTINDLRNERFILRERGSGTRMAVDAYLKAQRFTPNLRLELGNNEAIKEAVAGGLGIAIVSAHSFQAAGGQSGLAVLKVAGFPIKSAWHVVYRKGKQLSPIGQVFHEHLLSEAEKWTAKLRT
jgi:DNA-binding transcriptional LysR family regulator